MKIHARTLCLSLAVVLVTQLGGCAMVRRATVGEDSNVLSGAGSLMARQTDRAQLSNTEAFEYLDLDELVKRYGFDDPTSVDVSKDVADSGLRYRRNDLQQRIVSASNQKCGAYLRTIVSSRAETTTLWSGFATLFSGAASVLGHAATAKAFAAGSTVSNGVLGTFNEAYFNNLAVNIIASGITARRLKILETIEAGKGKSMSAYPVNAAIADAVEYHAACNIISGMETAANATKDAASTSAGNAAKTAASNASGTTK